MIKKTGSLVSSVICATVMVVVMQGCGSGGSNETTKAGTVRPKTVLAGTIGVAVNGISLTLTLPAGVSVKADSTSGEVNSGVITMLSPNDTSSYSTAKYTSASRTLTIAVIRGAVPFSPGDFFTITCDVAAGVSTQNMVITVDKVSAHDGLGAEIIPTPTATASL